MKLDLAAVLLAGGRSRRMGRDKAFLPWGKPPEPLWHVQWQKLHALRPREGFISCRAEQPFPPEAWTEAQPVRDAMPDSGPLGGIVAALEACTTTHLIIFGIDLPLFPQRALEILVAASAMRCGAVFRRTEEPQLFEPMAMILPREAVVIARAHLTQQRLALQDLCHALLADQRLVALPCPEDDAWFKNLNAPADCAS
jgi:molybdenum cofactor guanylyltransferase